MSMPINIQQQQQRQQQQQNRMYYPPPPAYYNSYPQPPYSTTPPTPQYGSLDSPYTHRRSKGSFCEDLPSSPASTTSQQDRRKTPTSWDPNDDMILRHLKEQLKLGWKEIASHFPNRTTNACQFRWRRLMSGTLRNNGGNNNSGSGVSSASISAANSTAPSTISSPLTTTAISPLHTPPTSIQHFQLPSIQPPLPLKTELFREWSKDEDELLLSRKDLRTDELSLLLSQRSESEIKDRIAQLTANNSGILTPITPSVSNSPKLTAVTCRPSLAKPTGSYFHGLKLPAPILQRRHDSITVPALETCL
jgi:hypothetical protein